MLGDAIEYKSGDYDLCNDEEIFDTKSQNGIKCDWSGTVYSFSYKIDFKWKFDWSELKKQGVDEITGHVTVSSREDVFSATRIYVKITEDNQEITKEVRSERYYEGDTVRYEYTLIPHYAPVLEMPDYDKMFEPSDQNDTILVVEGKKLHVNKTFLSYHSEYFRALFSSNFKEGQMDEIPIGDVSYEDFALLLSAFYPNPVFPCDSIVEKLLEMASRFMVSSVVNIIEYHLLNNSRINSEKMLWMAEEYVMPKLLEKCSRELNTEEKAPVLEKRDYDEMFAPSDQNDTILVVDKKKLHVNKSFLSYHSEYFRKLFSSNNKQGDAKRPKRQRKQIPVNKEGKMDEIPIEDVSFEDFALLLSTFYPNPVFPTDRNVKKLLEMARRFMVSSVVNIIEYHLMNNSRIKNAKMLWLADEYVMPKLLEKSIYGLDTDKKAKKLKRSEEYKKLSDSAKAKVLDRLIQLF